MALHVVNTPLDVCNLALLRINQPIVSDIESDSGSPQAILCNRFYDLTLRCLLSAYNWSFATVMYQSFVPPLGEKEREKEEKIRRGLMPDDKVPEKIPGTPEEQYEYDMKKMRDKPSIWAEYKYEHRVPYDFLRLVCCYSRHGNLITTSPDGMKPLYLLEGGFLLSDLNDIFMKYVCYFSLVQNMPAIFVDCLVLSLAMKMCKFLIDSAAYSQQLQEELEFNLERAKSVEAQQIIMTGMPHSSPLLRLSEAF